MTYEEKMKATADLILGLSALYAVSSSEIIELLTGVVFDEEEAGDIRERIEAFAKSVLSSRSWYEAM